MVQDDINLYVPSCTHNLRDVQSHSSIWLSLSDRSNDRPIRTTATKQTEEFLDTNAVLMRRHIGNNPHRCIALLWGLQVPAELLICGINFGDQ